MMRVYVGCFSACPLSCFCLLETLFLAMAFLAVSGHGLQPKTQPQKDSSGGAHENARCLKENTNSRCVAQRRWSERREKSLYQTLASDQNATRSSCFFSLRRNSSLTWSHLISNYLSQPNPCGTVQPLSNIPVPSLYHLSFLFDVKSQSATNLTSVDY